MKAFAVVPFRIPKLNCATYFPEANPLVPVDSVAEKSNTPTSKYVVISVRKGDGQDQRRESPDAAR